MKEPLLAERKNPFVYIWLIRSGRIMQNDWRLLNQEEYLMNAKLTKSEYKKPSEKWDHDHCAFCWDKFSKNDGDLHEGCLQNSLVFS